MVQPDGKRACLYHTDIANQQGSTGVGNACGGNRLHAFVTPNQYDIKNGGSHEIYVWATNPNSTKTKHLGHSPLEYTYQFSGTPEGWDYSLTKKCVKTPLAPGSTNYYEDTSECSSSNYWSLAIQAEATLGVSCGSGGNTQSLPWSGYNAGVLQFWWTGAGSNLTANLKTDIFQFSHPCAGEDVYNWAVFGESNNAGAGQLPKAYHAGIRVTAYFNHWLPNADTRFFVSCAGDWDGHSNVATINIIRTFTADAFPNDPEMIQCYDANLPGCTDAGPGITQLSLDGNAMGFSMPLATDTTFNVNCGSVFRHLVDRGYFPAPTSWNNSQLTKIFVGHEMRNYSTSNAGVSSLRIKKYEIEDIDY